MAERVRATTPFQRHSEIIGSALSLCEQIYQGSLGADSVPGEKSRIAQNPVDVLSNMIDVLSAAARTAAEEAVR